MKKNILSLFSLLLFSSVVISCGNHKSENDNETETRVYTFENHDKKSSTSSASSRMRQVKESEKATIPDEPVSRLHVTDVRDGVKVLGNQAGNSYHATNLFDDNPSTGWAIRLEDTPGESDMIYGPSMNINAKQLDYIMIRNGYGKNSESFYKNTRAKWIEIYRDSENEFPDEEDIIYSGRLKDTMEPQKLKVNPSYDNSRPTGQVQLRFKTYVPGYDNGGYYYGSKWNDLVISELEFFGVPLK